MASIGDLLQKIILLTSNVDSLKADVKRLSDVVMQQQERIIRLENSGELIAEKAKNAALASASVMTQAFAKELYETKAEVSQLRSTASNPSIQLSRAFDNTGRADATKTGE